MTVGKDEYLKLLYVLFISIAFLFIYQIIIHGQQEGIAQDTFIQVFVYSNEDIRSITSAINDNMFATIVLMNELREQGIDISRDEVFANLPLKFLDELYEQSQRKFDGALMKYMKKQ